MAARDDVARPMARIWCGYGLATASVVLAAALIKAGADLPYVKLHVFLPLLALLLAVLVVGVRLARGTRRGPGNGVPDPSSTPRVFLSHSSKDKRFVRQLVQELKRHDVQVWFDEWSLGVGDSIVAHISHALRDADYLLVVLSKNSVGSPWVQKELNSALMEEYSGRGIVVLPAVIDDCEVPILLRDRIYADFRQDFSVGLTGLLRVLEQETQVSVPSRGPMSPKDAAASAPGSTPQFFPPSSGPMQPEDRAADCPGRLSSLKLAELRLRMASRMTRDEVLAVWFDVLETRMEDDMQQRTLVECVIELLIRVRNRRKLPDLIGRICSDRPDLADP